MYCIVAADKNWGIGLDNRLLVSIPKDMQFFKDHTMGHVVVMGRKTLESFPGGRPLKGRINLVLTRDPSYQKEGALILHSLEELKNKLKSYPDEEIYCIGGEQIYHLLLPLCDKAYVTRIDASYHADAFFPDLDRAEDWSITEEVGPFFYEEISYRFLTYEKTLESDDL